MFTLPSMDYSAGEGLEAPEPWAATTRSSWTSPARALEDSLGRVLIIDRLGAAVTPWA
jgi:hypothetical protein